MVLSPGVLFVGSSPLLSSPRPPFASFLPAGAGLNGHVGINLQYEVAGFIPVQHGQGTHLFWDTAGLGNPRDDPNCSHYTLDGGVVRWP